MKTQSLTMQLARGGVALLTVSWLGAAPCGARAQDAVPPPPADAALLPPPTPDQEMPEVLTRGPVHEAYAEPVNLQVQTGLQVPTAPPANIQEAPPAERPQGERVIWIPGYWSWDAERANYIWVSGCWRIAPPAMSWVPGYWRQVAVGWEWVPGFWTQAGAQEITYLPEPPACDESAPPPPPSPDYTWVPSCWYWNQTQYVMRPGYWLAPHPGWCWVPTHYCWTPRGYVMAEGHWDYPFENRGVLFAPVCWSRPYYYGRPGFVYTPGFVIDTGAFSIGLFAYPRYSHYYFGDYYDDGYMSMGIYPWYDYQRLHGWYCPIFAYERSHRYHSDPRWEEHERHEFQARHDNRDLRPARTYHDMQARIAQAPAPQRGHLQVARPLAEVVKNRAGPLKFEPASRDAHERVVRQASDQTRFREERSRWEDPKNRKEGPQPDARGVAANLERDRAAKAEHERAAERPRGSDRVAIPPPADDRRAAAAAQSDRARAAAATKSDRDQRERAAATERTRAAERTSLPGPADERRAAAGAQSERDRAAAAQALKDRGAAASAERERSADRDRAAAAQSERARAADRAAVAAPTRDVHMSQPERVRIPSPPTADRGAAVSVGRDRAPAAVRESSPPPRPSNESSDRAGDSKDSRKDGADRGRR